MLRKLRVVNGERKGLWIYYSLNRALPAFRILACSFGNLRDLEPYCKELEKIASAEDNICDKNEKSFLLTAKFAPANAACRDKPNIQQFYYF